MYSRKSYFSNMIIVSFLLLLFSGVAVAAGNDEILKNKRILYVPLDNRPVCLDYVVDTFGKVPVQFRVAPKHLLSHQAKPGDADALWEWVRGEAGAVDVMVIAADSLIYGGLVPSRRHDLDASTLNMRMDRFKELKKANPSLQIYLFTTIMRTPRSSSGGTEPDYYEIWGPQVFRLTQLYDLQDRGMLDENAENELTALKKSIPEKIQEDWFRRRSVNRRINEHWISWAKEGFVDYLIICRDDSAEFSQSQREWRSLEPQTEGLPETRFRAFPGTDEVGMLLLTRSINDLTFKTPRIGVVYGPGVGGGTIPSYEDQPVNENVEAHIYAMGGFPAVTTESADLIFLVNTPKDGKTLEASHQSNQPNSNDEDSEIARSAVRWLRAKKPVAIADISFSNGADRGLMKALEEKKVLYKINAYAGWNTAGNSIGYALSQGYLSKEYLSRAESDRLLTLRYLDDWGYQSMIRNEVNQKLIWPNQMNGASLGDSTYYVQANIEIDLRNFIKDHLIPAGMDKSIKLKSVSLPWQRMFEILPVLEK